jgi:hypothetical protein
MSLLLLLLFSFFGLVLSALLLFNALEGEFGKFYSWNELVKVAKYG